MRPSKLRLPDSTDATTRLCSAIAWVTAAGSGPEFPMQVVEPYATMWKPSCSSAGITPASCRYADTTCEPGANDVFTHGLRERPRATAFWARRPAAMSSGGFEVFVQLVMAASTTEPFCTLGSAGTEPFGTVAPGLTALVRAGRAPAKPAGTWPSATRSWG